jgi:hypothetical protein
MKAETEPITPEEWLIRLVWHERFSGKVPIISKSAFEPRKPETEGISFFREDCLSNPEEALLVIAEEKRPRYGMVRVSVSQLRELNYTVQSKPIQTIPGHVVIPELNYTEYSRNRSLFVLPLLTLAKTASDNIIRKPPG